jgi:formate dehydrogenase gamma subunit
MAGGRLGMGSAALAALLAAITLAPAAKATQRPAQDESCLACHGQPGMKSADGRDIYVEAAKHGASVHGGLTCTTCHSDIKEYPHPKKVAKVQCATCHPDAAANVPKSIHGAALGAEACAACHGQPHLAARASAATAEICASCHADAVRDFSASVHGQARKAGDADSPTCASCHGAVHKVLPAADPASPVAKKNLPDTCGACHANPVFLARHQIPFARPVEAYRLSVHGRALAAGNASAPSCSDCHSNHAIFRPSDQRAKTNHWNVVKTCGTCHTAIEDTYVQSIHGQAVAQGVRDAPVCTDCHGEHTILAPTEAESLVNPGRVSTVTCGRCHADERLTKRYNLPVDKVPAFQDSYHGLALRAGSQVVANCASCHGVHNILPSNDPRSTINAANIARTCGACHAGAGQRFGIGPVHVRSASRSEHPVVRFIRQAYLVLIPLTLGFMVLHNGIDFFAKLIRGAQRSSSGETVERMNRHFRIAHWLVVVSFPTLVITGFALKFPEAWWVQPLLHWQGAFALRGTLHRTAAIILIGSMVYHFIHLSVLRRDRVMLKQMIPVMRDVQDLWSVARYNLGLTNDRPQFGKFNYAEKVEYLAFLWGSVVMALSGFLLWFNNFTLRHFPKWVADAATTVHYYEAILATFSILIWHFYMTIFDPDVYPMDLAWITGKVPSDHLKHLRPAYYLELVRQQKRAKAAEAANENAQRSQGESERKPD